eukprot:gene22446-161_t
MKVVTGQKSEIVGTEESQPDDERQRVGKMAELKDEIVDLPGAPKVSFKMYSGYLTVDAASGRQLFYMFAESQNDPASDPVALWLNGGPGCSSLIGFFDEHGPFRPTFASGGTELEELPAAWNKVANTLYLEAPAGVGFSFSNNKSDYIVGDTRTAQDNYHALVQFFTKFPSLKGNDFWVTGESYGGHYTPELTNAILEGNKQAPPSQQINIKGLMAGNAWTDPELGAWGVVEQWWTHALISRETYNDIYKYCTYTEITYWIINNVSAQATVKMSHDGAGTYPEPNPGSKLCYDALIKGSKVEFGNIDITAIYSDMCVKGAVQKGSLPGSNPCIAQNTITYLNQPAVQAAIHANPTKWAPCSSTISYQFFEKPGPLTSMVPYYTKFMNETNLRILVFSGDVDAIVPFPSTRAWIETLSRPILVPFRAWYTDTNGPQVGGWVTTYDRLTFTTVRNAGHEVPVIQPGRALYMFEKFLKGESF